MPLQIYMAESAVTMEQLADNVNDQLKSDGRCMVVVSEGFDVGKLGERRDSFGHVQFSASETTVEQIVVNYLNQVGLAARVRREAMCRDGPAACDGVRLAVDLEEAYQLGRKAVLIALDAGSGYMSTVLREPGAAYRVRYDKAPLQLVANSERNSRRRGLRRAGAT